MYLTIIAALAFTISTLAPAKNFSEFCLSPDQSAQKNTLFRMLRAVGLPAKLTSDNCAAGERALRKMDSLEFKYIVAHIPHSFLTEEVEPITDLRPLESVPHLKRLTLEGPTIKQAFALTNPLVPLSNLRELSLSDVPLSHINFIEPLINLEDLTVVNMELNEISVLEHAKQLRSLNISGNEVSDLTVLAKLPKLVEFTFHAGRTSESLGNLEFVRPLIALRALRLTGHSIKYLNALENLKELETLDLYSNRVMDVEPIAGLVKLKELNLNSNNIHDISLLKKLTDLQRLFLAVNHITDPKALQGLLNLRTLDISGNAIGYLSLHKQTKLESIRAISCQLTNLYGIPENARIKSLELSHNKITSLDRLAFMPEIESAIFYQNEISEIWQLRPNRLLKLRHLSLSRNRVDNVEPLAGYLNLLQLDIHENPVTDFSPLAPLQLPHTNTEGAVVQLWLQH